MHIKQEGVYVVPGKSHPTTIGRVFATTARMSKKNPGGRPPHKLFGESYTTFWSERDVVLFLPEEVIEGTVKEISATHGLTPGRVRQLLHEVSEHTSRYFYSQGRFQINDFLYLWGEVCRFERLFASNYEPWYWKFISERIFWGICAPLASDPSKIVKWYDFALRCRLDEMLDTDFSTSLFVAYGSEEIAAKYRLCLHQHGDCEADYYLAIIRAERTKYDTKPHVVALIGFRQVDAVTWSIENLQGKEKIRRDYIPLTGFVEVHELGQFDWRRVLVSALEQIAQQQGIERILFRPGDDNFHYSQYRNGQNARFATNFLMRYNGTARQTGYRKTRDISGKKVYVKNLVSGDCNCPVALPAHRHDREYLAH